MVIFGFKAINNLVLSTSVINLFKEKEKNAFFDLILFWKHSLAVAVCSKIISRHLDTNDDSEEYFVAGLLHDIGKLIFNQYFREGFIKALNDSKTNRRELIESEKQLNDFNHCILGSLLLQKWNLPENIIDSVELHHFPERSKNYSNYVYVVHLADIIVNALKLGESGNPYIPRFSQKAWEALKLSENLLEPIMTETHNEALEIFDIFQK